ncbi:uncharacterized protein LOC110466774 isoform X2 [Mizuhopecten yessoensis]|uniref:uncharacterized protein LOC110466774 isoform X2 n=1 Tax=Mizuhopecten yessoensis TaxID=6573 RepID=UPI000B45E3ED|nr:uncharacterized protein LOC110466774 isoform X2 [Mizuhopecten yessoensis]
MFTAGYHDSTMHDDQIERDVNDGSNLLLPLAISLNLGKHYGSRRELDLRYKFREARESQRKMVAGDEIHECGPRGEGFRTTHSKASYFKTCDKLVVLCTMYDSQRSPNSFSLSEVPGKATHYTLKLITYGLSRNQPIYDLCIQKDGNWYLSHQRLKNANSEELALSARDTIAGPNFGADDGPLVPCLPCSTWPPASFSMVQRPRRSGWPAQEVMDRMVRKGCFVVPSDDDNDEETVFMLSFAVPERELVKSFNQTQMNVYGYWLSIIDQKVPASLKTVFNETVVKHCLFWLLQEYPLDTWMEVNVTRCMELLLGKFLDVTRNRSCPNFFVKRYDLFMAMTPVLLANLLNFLNDIEQAGRSYFLQLVPFCQRAEDFRNLQQSFAMMCVTDVEEERRLDFAFFQEVLHTYYEMRRLFQHATETSKPFDLDMFNTIIVNLLERSSPLLDDNIKAVLKAYLSLQMACHLCRDIPNVGNSRQTEIARIEDLLKEGLNADMSSAKLKMATLYLHLEKPERSVEILQDLDATGSHVINLTRRCKSSIWIEINANDRDYEQTVCNKGFSRAEKVTRFMALPFDITKDEQVVVPEVIQYELAEVSGSKDGRITSNFTLYYHLLLIISKHKLGEDVHQTIQEFKKLVEESSDEGVLYMYYNWLGYCLKLVKRISEAKHYFEESLKIKHSENAAMKQLDALK